ncbi:MAG: phaC PHA synthase [Myxococcota bacterium]|nr:phaC PHA synthase [Myxococcota bacterium]
MTRPSLLLAVVLGVALPAWADAPLQFSTVGVRAPDDPHVNGIRLSVLYGRNQRVRGVDLGVIAQSRTGDLTGFGAVLGLGRLDGDLRGCHASVINHHTGRDRGVNAAFVNQVQAMDAGVNLGFVNTTNDFAMVDVGGINVSDRGVVQVGFLNVTRRLRGVQIGFLNVADNGFLPVFPIFNFPKRTPPDAPARTPPAADWSDPDAQ